MLERRAYCRVFLFLVFLGAFLGLSGSAGAATFTVLNTNDSGADSLRAAITAANAVAGPHTIEFDIPGAGPHLIGLLSELPDLVQTMTIDGYSQPGSSPNTNPFNLGLDTVLRIGLDGSGAGPAEGLTLVAPDIVIRGLAIYGFSGQIRVERPRAVIAGNFLGTNIAGTADADGVIGGFGVAIGGAAITGGDGSVIGGAAEADRNLISGMVFGVSIEGREVAIRYNLVGTDISGTVAISNETGIYCRADDEIVEIDHNLVSGNINGTGIALASQGPTGFCRVTRNYVGTNVDATLPLGNYVGIGAGAGPHEIGGPIGNIVGGNEDAGIVIGGNGIRLMNNGIGTQLNVGSPDLGNGGAGIRVQVSSDIQIGDSHLETNVFRFNGAAGILVVAPSTRITVGHSSFLENGGLAIDLGEDGVTPNDPGDTDAGPNQRQNFPEIVAVGVTGGQTIVEMELDGALPGTYRIQLYTSLACDPTGFGEGHVSQVIEDVVADANGDASFAILVNGDLTGDSVAATATDPNGNTSEFSRCALVLGPPLTEVPSLGALGMLILAAFLAVAGLAKIAS